MTKEQVEKLRQAGISESAIIDRILEEGEPIPEKPDTVPAEPAAAPAEPEPEKPEAKPEKPDRTDQVLAAIEKLTGAVLGHNVNGSGISDLGKSGDDIIGELLRGEPKK